MSHRGRFNAILPLISGLGFTVSTPIAGRIEDAWGIPALWLIVGLASALAACGLAMLGVSERRALRRIGVARPAGPTPEREPLA
jgi:predicted MFS family arabinose efflux permease